MLLPQTLEIEDIAVALDISKTAVTSRHLRAVQQLRQLLGNESGAGEPMDPLLTPTGTVTVDEKLAGLLEQAGGGYSAANR